MKTLNYLKGIVSYLLSFLLDSCYTNAEEKEGLLCLKQLIALFLLQASKTGLRVQIRVHVCFLGQVPSFSLSCCIKGNISPLGTNGIALLKA